MEWIFVAFLWATALAYYLRARRAWKRRMAVLKRIAEIRWSAQAQRRADTPEIRQWL